MADKGPLVFRVGAIVNWVVTIGAVIDPNSMAATFGVPPANYPFLMRIWSGMAFMFGCMFWEIARDMPAKRALIKYAWIEKSVTAISVTLGFIAGSAPAVVFVLVVFTDWLWIPLFAYYDVQVRRRATARGKRSSPIAP
jgi:hypothetical protein